MTREEALLKLLAVEPETKDQILIVTGWPADEAEAVLQKLVAQRLVTFRNGAHGADGRRVYYPRQS